MDKYLLEILKDVNTIIIPGLGALTITNHDTGEIMFMPYLQHDDSKLSTYIAEKEGMEEADAKNLIAKYVREILTKLDQGETYDMYQFGTFKKDETGDVVFINWDGATHTEENTESKDSEVSPITAELDTSDKAEENSESIPEEASTEEVVDQISVIEENKPEPIVEIEETPTTIVEEKKAEDPIASVIDEPKKELNIAEKEEIEQNQAKLAQLKKQQENKKEKRKRAAGFYMLISLVAIMILGGIYVGLNFNEIKQHIPFLADAKESTTNPSPLEEMKDIMGLNDEDEERSESETETELEEPIVEEVENEDTPEVTVPEKTVPKVQNNSSGDYHVIAGAFASETNANRLGDKLRSEGYTVKVGTGNGMHLVSIKSFNTNEEAKNSLSELKSVAPHAWIYYWPN